LRDARVARGWTQARLAARSGVGRATVGRLEAGAGSGRAPRRPVADTVFRLAAALDKDAWALVPGWAEWAPVGTASLGARSRDRRRSLGLSLDTVAAAAGVSTATLSRFEREERQVPSLVRVETSELGGRWEYPVSLKLARALGFDSVDEHAGFCLRR